MTGCGSSGASSSNVRPRKISHRPVSSYVPSASRSSERGQFNNKSTAKKRSIEGESSSSRGERKTTNASPVDSATRRSMTVNPRTRVYNRQNGRNVSETCDNELLQFSASGSRSFSLSGNNSDNPSDTMLIASDEREFTRFMNDDALQMLLALERIEQDEELTHADLLELETTLFLGGLNLYDRHREMRLDIDDMSYEELLALEERMGTVSTAIPREALSKCLARSVYEAGPLKVQLTGSANDGDDIKCSICQEEYVTGDEIGTLVECKHGYHATCVNQWLQLKNWCPVCKTSAAPSQSPSSL
ncbi:probable E3 ubiquitin-protein ligase hip1 [Phtheirospermum japonicum]|uniref:RING-type E3 ubiquitin transferase n=1 Tax=Phtheirospermum japonicum TaxID=374723 RepID=A0A830BHV2_9LAMI|nr:probable E3 ubiquitin-protein ligase hip1 [Phtheirospermum japonicum]